MIADYQQDYAQLWENVLVDIELGVSRINFKTWFKNTTIISYDDGVVTLRVPNEFVRQWFVDKHHRMILRLLRERLPSVRSLEYIVIEKPEHIPKQETVSITTEPTVKPNQLPLSQYTVNREDNLNPRYSFDTFVVGPFNQLAHAAALAVVKNPGLAYNPLFLAGGTGHGKTHLMQAVGNAQKASNPARKIYYITSEKYIMDFVTAMQRNKITLFKERFRQYDVFIMDDIQFLAGKEKTQEELFHLFNSLYDSNKQVIFSSDKHPNFLSGIDARLVSRFAAGMVVDVPAPDHESRLAILQAKVGQSGVVISQQIINFLAETVDGNIRELEGALNTLLCQAQLSGHEPTLAETKNLVRESVRPKRSISVSEVIKLVASFYGIDEHDITEKTRRKEVVRPRQLIMYILREDFHVSFPLIGQKLGGRDHTTVIHSCEKVRADLLKDPLLEQEIDRIRALLK